MNQRTIKKTYSFEGKGLHTGCFSHMVLKPAPVNTGVVFVRTDLNVEIPALAQYVTHTSRSTTITSGKASVSTIEHVMSALTGLDIDNVIIEIDNKEVPILDGSARFYVESILPDGLEEQDAERKWIEFKEEIEFKNENTGSYIRIIPSEEPGYEVTIDFDSKVLGIQTTHWNYSESYADEVAPCRTFCFLHEIRLLAMLGLVKGGDVENAIVVVEKPVTERELLKLSNKFGQPRLSVTPEGYLSNLVLRFPDECGRHKLLDIIGDLRLCGGFLKAKVVAYKPGHSINTRSAKKIQTLVHNNG
ncbi:MAG: UDP-3-O-acyl-N-acetylglucosamine deacetylase [Bacteroidales bacterium]|nr:UDP-3-O-acyl-N-acetylglucosamine deacetylase [Bacteroidales bacterium]